MTAVSYTLGRPRPAGSRGGDCRAKDLNQGRNVRGPHYFYSPSHCQICNGLLRITVGPGAAAPSLTIDAWRGRVVINDLLSDILSDTLPGEMSVPEWLPVGTVTIDSPSVSAVLTAVRIVRACAESITIRLVAPLMSDAFVTLPRGWRSIRIQHGSSRPPLTDIDRRIRWTASPSPVGTASEGRVEEMTPTTPSFPRMIAAIDPVTANAAQFSLTAASVTTARFGAGVATYKPKDRPSDLHRQLGDASRPVIVLTEDD